MSAIQLDFFETEEESDLSCLRKDVSRIRDSSDKVRRGTYARLNEHYRKMLDMEHRLDIIERGLCYGKLSSKE
jgi:uncharacterized protein Yka (UPF0111/DUF47 family)